MNILLFFISLFLLVSPLLIKRLIYIFSKITFILPLCRLDHIRLETCLINKLALSVQGLYIVEDPQKTVFRIINFKLSCNTFLIAAFSKYYLY